MAGGGAGVRDLFDDQEQRVVHQAVAAEEVRVLLGEGGELLDRVLWELEELHLSVKLNEVDVLEAMFAVESAAYLLDVELCPSAYSGALKIKF